MKIDLSNKRAVVTGSTAGIGFAIASGLAQAGASVVINGRSSQKVDAAKKVLLEKVPGAKVEGVAADLATAQGVADFIKRVPDADILVNNLGIFEPKAFEDITDADWTRFFETNVMSGIRMSRAYLPGMKKKDWGRIVFISSESGLNIPPEMIHYGVTKTAQLAVARGLAESVAGTGITVNSVLPGPTRSDGVLEFSARWRRSRASHKSRWKRTSSPSTGRPRSSSGWPRSMRWRIWSFTSVRRRLPPRPVRLCASRADCCARLDDVHGVAGYVRARHKPLIQCGNPQGATLSKIICEPRGT